MDAGCVELVADSAETSRVLAAGAPSLAHDLRSSGLGLDSVNVTGGGAASHGGHQAAGGESAGDGRPGQDLRASLERAGEAAACQVNPALARLSASGAGLRSALDLLA